MRRRIHGLFCPLLSFFVFTLLILPAALFAQSGAGTVSGTVTDPSAAAVPGAAVTILNRVSQYSRTGTTDSAGHFTFPNIPFNPYQLEISAKGFAPYSETITVNSVVPVAANATLQVSGSSTTVTVTGGGELVEDTPTFHTDVDRNLMQKLPLESQSSSLSSLVTLASPGVAPIPTASFTASAIMRRTHFPLTASR